MDIIKNSILVYKVWACPVCQVVRLDESPCGELSCKECGFSQPIQDAEQAVKEKGEKL